MTSPDPLLKEIRDVCTAAIDALARSDLVSYQALVEKETRLMEELRAKRTKLMEELRAKR